MRIISQNETVDIPYKKAVVYVDATDNTVCARLSDKTAPVFFLGEYESAEDALFVMRCIRKEASMHTHYFDMPSKEDAQSQREALENDDLYKTLFPLI